MLRHGLIKEKIKMDNSTLQQQIADLQSQITNMGSFSNITHDQENALRERLGLNTPTAVVESFPINSIFISTVATDPSVLLGYGTWSVYGAGKVLVGYDSNDATFSTLGNTGGEKTHVLTTTEMPAHTHPGLDRSSGSESGPSGSSAAYASATHTGSTGGDQPHNNLQPYIVVIMWHRTA